MNNNKLLHIFVIFVLYLSFLFISSLLYNKKPNEGMVMNKMISQGYFDCTEMNECVYSPTKFIIAIQNGEDKDWWFVTEEYYNSVSIGNWVKR